MSKPRTVNIGPDETRGRLVTHPTSVGATEGFWQGGWDAAVGAADARKGRYQRTVHNLDRIPDF
jgi:hypothetical protein